MSNAQKAFEKWRDESPNQRYGEMNKLSFLAGYAAAIEEIRNGGPVATVKTLHGVQVGYIEQRVADETFLYTLPKE